MNLSMTASQTSANDIQVGGTHYQDNVGACPYCAHPIQHWDLFGRGNYLVGNITKYFTRFLSKNGLQDVKKGLHYVQKACDVFFPGQLRITVEDLTESKSALQIGSKGALSDVASGVVASPFAKVQESGTGYEVVSRSPDGTGLVVVNDLDAAECQAREAREAYEARCTHATPLDDQTALVAARQRAESFAQARPNSDVPTGYVLERVHGESNDWHWRKAQGGNWSQPFQDRCIALAAIHQNITQEKSPAH